MKLKPDDLQLLRGPLLFLLAAVLISLVWWVGTWQYLRVVEGEQDAMRRSLGAARAQLENAHTQQKYFGDNQATYAELKSKGLFDKQKRLEWIELITQLRDRRQIFSIDYNISAQKPFVGMVANLPALTSKIDLKIALLHEQDLLNFLKDFQQQAPGVFLLDFCSLQRSGDVDRAEVAPNIEANCTLQWLTLKENGA